MITLNPTLTITPAGKLSYPMFDLSEGWHSLTVKVWDVFNNSSEETIEFRVMPAREPDHFPMFIIIRTRPAMLPGSDSNTTSPAKNCRLIIHVFDMEGRHVACHPGICLY